MAGNLERSSLTRRKQLSRVKSGVARAFLFRHGYNSSSFVLPEFYEPVGFSEMSLEPIQWTNHGARNLRQSSGIELVTPKGEVGWRRFSLLHPYAYWHIVSSLTEEGAWPVLRSLLSTPNCVASYTVPRFSLREKKIQGDSIKAWLGFAETDLIADSAPFNHLGVTDIQNFYPSVYTHSLAWAVDGRAVIKKNQRNCLDYIGNRIDRVFQSAHAGQTNGIPIGTMVSDIVAELLLTAVDVELSKRFKAEDVRVARYRDDYRVLAKNYHGAKEVVSALGEVLRNECDLHLSDQKTDISADIIQRAIRPWSRSAAGSIEMKRVVEPSEHLTGRDLKGALLAIYALQQQYPGAGVAISRLQAINEAIEKWSPKLELRIDDLRGCIAILRTFMHIREDTAPHVMILADMMLTEFSDAVARPLVEEMVAEESTVKGNDFLEIWLYRLAQHRFPDIGERILEDTKNPLLRMVRMERPHVEEFEEIDGLGGSDRVELEKFQLVNPSKLRKVVSKPLDSSIVQPWRSRY